MADGCYITLISCYCFTSNKIQLFYNNNNNKMKKTALPLFAERKIQVYVNLMYNKNVYKLQSILEDVSCWQKFYEKLVYLNVPVTIHL